MDDPKRLDRTVLEGTMISALATISAALTLVLTGGVAGVFYAFSVSVMQGLDGLRAEQAILAMQSINRRILNPAFLASFLGAPVAALSSGVLLLILGQSSAAILFFLGASVYLVGAFVPTVVVNVPMNNALEAAKVPHHLDEAARLWSGYSARWTRWNTVRAISSSISLLLTGLALYLWGRQW